MIERATDPLRIPEQFWLRIDVSVALTRHDIRQLLILVRRHSGAGQTKIGAAIGLSQGAVSDIMAGKRRVVANHVHERIAAGLNMPDTARAIFGLAPYHEHTPPVPITGVQVPAQPGPNDSDRTVQGKADGDVDRRGMLRLSVAAAGAATAPIVAAARIADVVHALTNYEPLANGIGASEPPPTVAALAKATAAAKRHYQACRYAMVLDELPALLQLARSVTETTSGDSLLRAHRLAADAFQVAGSVMLKLEDQGLAVLAADRSMEAALKSGDPIAIAASARVITHSLMTGGHARRAQEIAAQAAQRLDRSVDHSSAEAVSVYGALVLRGAIAAARVEDRAGAAVLLDEADDAALRLGRDDNAYWTAFGPSNVLLHRVNVAVVLGDAGTAVDLAGHVDLARVALPERRAALFIDVANAYAQWGKHEQAHHALVMAEAVAPEELRARRSVHRLVADLARHAPGSIRNDVSELARRLRHIDD